MELFVVKLGGKILDDQAALNRFIKEVADSNKRLILVHGGGTMASRLAEKLNVPQQMIDGRRVTDDATLDLALMAYAGLLNKNLVANMQGHGINALGLSGADGNSVRATLKSKTPVDFGWVGVPEPDMVNKALIHALLQMNITPVFCALTHDGQGQMLNTNADTMAQVLAIALADVFEVKLVYLFEKKGVLAEVTDENSVINSVLCADIPDLKKSGTISDGMIPKLENACMAISKGVNSVIIGHPDDIKPIFNNDLNSSTHVHP